MSPLVWIVIGITWLAILALGFLLLGALRALGLQGWRLEQLEATTPSRIGRSGLKPGKTAPDFALPNATGGEVALARLRRAQGAAGLHAVRLRALPPDHARAEPAPGGRRDSGAGGQ